MRNYIRKRATKRRNSSVPTSRAGPRGCRSRLRSGRASVPHRTFSELMAHYPPTTNSFRVLYLSDHVMPVASPLESLVENRRANSSQTCYFEINTPSGCNMLLLPTSYFHHVLLVHGRGPCHRQAEARALASALGRLRAGLLRWLVCVPPVDFSLAMRHQHVILGNADLVLQPPLGLNVCGRTAGTEDAASTQRRLQVGHALKYGRVHPGPRAAGEPDRHYRV